MEIINPSEIVSKRFDDARSVVRNALKSSNDWKSLYGVTTVAEAYARGDIEIHLHLFFSSKLPVHKVKDGDAIFGKGHNITDFCIRMQRHPFIEFATSADKPVKSETTQSRSQDSDETMFVGIVKLLKKKKRVTPTLIPSLVWLKRLELCQETPVDINHVSIDEPTILTRPMSETSSMFFTISCPCSLADRKLSTRVGVITDTPQLPCQQVESRPEIVSNLSYNHSPFIRECGAIINPNVPATNFSIELGQDDSVAIVFEKILSNILQGYELAVYPSDFSSWPIKLMHSKTIQRNEHIV